jgi:outer membrane protein TolC
MKKILQITLSILLFVTSNSYAQESILKDINYSDLQKYIDLAKQNYSVKKISDAQKEVVKLGVTTAKLSYLEMFNSSYFYRPNRSAVIDVVNPYNVNGVQFGVSLNLGNFLQKPFAVKRAKAQYNIAVLESEQTDVLIGMEVKRRYYDYIQQISQLKISTKSAQDNKGVAENLRSKFEKGEITLDAYNQSRVNQSESDSQKIQAEVNFLKSKDLLEEIIGMKLSDVK